MIVPKLRNPILLAHGMAGFDEMRVGPWKVARYWPGIHESLCEAGNCVMLGRVSGIASVADRAAELKVLLDRLMPTEPVHIIAHSMGGLDARYLISRLGMAERVLTLTTIGTPHRGTAFADWGLREVATRTNWLVNLLGLPVQAFRDVSIEGCVQFNQEVPDAPKVRYFSVAGEYLANWLAPEWQLSWRVVTEAQGANDGLVPVESARYGEDCAVWQGDHVSLINWSGPLAKTRRGWEDRVPQYAGLIRRLADLGY